jgi:hypothetical protein
MVSRAPSPRVVVVRTAAVTGNDGADAGGARTMQLGTARLPPNVNEEAFKDAMFQWATTLTTSGQNMPFALPQKVDRTERGFDVEFLMMSKTTPGEFDAVGAISASVEEAEEKGVRVLMIRGYGNVMDLVDTPVIMGSMPGAIRRAFAVATM